MTESNANHPARALAQADCVILDFDGVIADSEEFQLRVWGQVLAEWGITPAEFSVQSIAGLLDRQALKNLWPDGSDQDHQALVARKAQECATRAHEVPSVPGIGELLESLHPHKRLFVCSSSATRVIVSFLSRHFPHIAFDDVIGAGDYTHFKPHPDPYLTVLRRAGSSMGEVIAVEDSLPGVQAARSARIEVIHFDRYRLGAKVAMTVHSLDDLRA